MLPTEWPLPILFQKHRAHWEGRKEVLKTQQSHTPAQPTNETKSIEEKTERMNGSYFKVPLMSSLGGALSYHFRRHEKSSSRENLPQPALKCTLPQPALKCTYQTTIDTVSVHTRLLVGFIWLKSCQKEGI